MVQLGRGSTTGTDPIISFEDADVSQPVAMGIASDMEAKATWTVRVAEMGACKSPTVVVPFRN